MIVVNDRLQSRWHRQHDARLVCIHAPGGYGKTTAAGWWASQLSQPVVWLYLEQDPGCRHVPTFLASLAEALAREAGLPSPAGESRSSDCLRLWQTAFPDGATVILDDYHLVANPELDDAVAALVPQLPANGRLILTSRQEVRWPQLPKWLGRRQAVVLDERDLQFGVSEIATYLDLPDQEAEAVLARTQGWVLSLNLLEGRHSPVPALAGRDFQEWLQAYLLGDLLAELPDETWRFMQVTALVEALTVGDCLAVGLRDPETHVERLRRHRFVIERQDGAICYHALVREALVATFPADERQHWQIRWGRHLFEQEHQACLPLFMAAGAWREACRAILWFQQSQWLEHHQQKPTATYWFQQLPASDLQDDPLYLCVVWLLRWRELDHAARVDLMARIESGFARQPDPVGEGFALIKRAAMHDAVYDRSGMSALMPRIAETRQAFGPGHLIGRLCSDLLISHALYVEPDRQRWERLMADLQQAPLQTPLDRMQRYLHHLNATEKYLVYGEFGTAQRHFAQTIDLMPRVPATRAFCVAMQAVMVWRLAMPPIVPDELARRILDEEARDHPLLRAVAQFYDGVMAWQRGDREGSVALMEQVSAFYAAETTNYWADVGTMARLVICEEKRLSGDLPAAWRSLRAAMAIDRSVYLKGELHWHLARVALAMGNQSEADEQRGQAERWARQHDDKFLLVRVLLLEARSRKLPVPDEAVALIERWQCETPLRALDPEGAEWAFGEAAAAAAPRVRIHTLGTFRVEIDGETAVWKRSNAQLLLLALLLSPAGVTSAQLEQRFWPTTGNAGLRTDLKALRETLEPGRPGRDSRFVQLQDGRYRWVADGSLCWWDAAEFETLAKAALKSPHAPEANDQRRQALALYQGGFVPEFEAFEPIRRHGEALHKLWRRLLGKSAD